MRRAKRLYLVSGDIPNLNNEIDKKSNIAMTRDTISRFSR
jgi:hypothetical protein